MTTKSHSELYCNHCRALLVPGTKKEGGNWAPSRQRRREFTCTRCNGGTQSRARAVARIPTYYDVVPAINFDPELDEVRRDIAAIASETDRVVQTRVKKGFVYVITNPSWRDWVSIGMATDYERRLSNYNRASPFSDYKLEGKFYSNDRAALEKFVHAYVERWFSRRGEWFQMTVEQALSFVSTLHREFNEHEQDWQGRDALHAPSHDRGDAGAPLSPTGRGGEPLGGRGGTGPHAH